MSYPAFQQAASPMPEAITTSTLVIDDGVLAVSPNIHGAVGFFWAAGVFSSGFAIEPDEARALADALSAAADVAEGVGR